MAVVRHKESIHSGQFMVSNFEAEDEDEEGDLDVPERYRTVTSVDSDRPLSAAEHGQTEFKSVAGLFKSSAASKADKLIDNNLSKLFQCMSIVYRQKLTSPKWNRFLGLKLRWKDKIRLNNVIWRCWHMQFVKRQRKLVFAFGNPIEIDNHSKTESGAIMMGKYWKRKMDSVLAEYKKWRIFYKNQNNGAECVKYTKADKTLIKTGQDDIDLESMITDADFFVDAIFNNLESQPLEFEDDWSKTCLNNSDLIQPGLIQLQPNLDDMLDLDPMAAMADWFSAKHPDPMRRKSLTPEQDIYNKKCTMSKQEPSYLVPPTNLEIQHNRSRTNNTVHSSPLTKNISNIHHKQEKVLPPTDSPQWFYQTSVITNSKKVSPQINVPVEQSAGYEADFSNRASVGTKRPAERSELAKLLQGDYGDPILTKPEDRIVQKPVKRQTVLKDKGSGNGLVLDPIIFKTFILIPPPPPGSLPQPSAGSGSSPSVVLVEDKNQVNAEKKRKGTIKNGFDMLRSVVPSLSLLPTIKISKAAQLNKAAEFIIELKEDNVTIQTELKTLRQSVEILHQDIRCSQALLPSRGSAVPKISSRPSQLEIMFCKHVDSCTRQNWKYWVFSKIMRPVLESYDRTVSSSSPDDLARTSSSWLDQHVTLVQLRPLVTKALKELSVETVILSEPHKMPLEALNSSASLSFRTLNDQ